MTPNQDSHCREAATTGDGMTFDTVFTLMMLLVIGSWIAALVIVAVVFRSFLHPTYGDGNLGVGGSTPARREGRHGQEGAQLSRDPSFLAFVASTSWWAPPLIAVVLAAISLPLVAHSLSIFDTSHAVSSSTPFLAGSDSRRWTTGAGAVLISALIAGTVGAPAVRRRLIAGAVFTFFLALIIAIAVFPITPANLGDHVGEVVFCIDGCNAIVDSWDPASGLRAAPFFAWAAFIEPAAVAALAVGVTLWSLVVRRLSEAASRARLQIDLRDSPDPDLGKAPSGGRQGHRS